MRRYQTWCIKHQRRSRLGLGAYGGVEGDTSGLFLLEVYLRGRFVETKSARLQLARQDLAMVVGLVL